MCRSFFPRLEQRLRLKIANNTRIHGTRNWTWNDQGILTQI